MKKGNVDLSIKIDEVKFRNPVFLSEGPLSGNSTLINRAGEHNLGAIVTKSIRTEEAFCPGPYMVKVNKGLINADWSDVGFKNWMAELDKINIKVPLIVNVATNHVDPKTAASWASVLQHKGASLVTFSDYEPENLIEVVGYAKNKVDIPIMVKLPPFRKNIAHLCRELEKAGVSCIAAMDAIGPAMDIDIETAKNVLGCKEGFGYLSSEPIFPFTLAYIAEICRNVTVPVLAVGGVTSYKEVVKLIMVGATAVGISGGAILNGLGIFDTINDDLINWMIKKGYSSLDEFRGVSNYQIPSNKNKKVYKRCNETDEEIAEGGVLKAINKSEKQDRDKVIDIKELIDNHHQKASVNEELCVGCGLCLKSCFKQAIVMEDKKIKINLDLCAGCGLCISVCPMNSINMI